MLSGASMEMKPEREGWGAEQECRQPRREGHHHAAGAGQAAETRSSGVGRAFRQWYARVPQAPAGTSPACETNHVVPKEPSQETR